MLHRKIDIISLLSKYHTTIHRKSLAIIKLEYFLLLSFIRRVFCAFTDIFKCFFPRLSPKGHAMVKFLSLHAI